jgi:hypothetical protein
MLPPAMLFEYWYCMHPRSFLIPRVSSSVASTIDDLPLLYHRDALSTSCNSQKAIYWVCQETEWALSSCSHIHLHIARGWSSECISFSFPKKNSYMELVNICPGLESQEYSLRDPSHWPRGTFSPQKLTLTSPTSSGRLVSIVRSQTQATGFSF